MLQEWGQNKVFKALVFGFLVFAIVALVAYARLAYKQGDSAEYQTISVVGVSEMFVKPDIAEFTFSVMAEEKDATAAQGKSAEKSNAVKAYLKEMGVEEKDIKTTYYNLMPKYEWAAAAPYDSMMYPSTNQNQVLVGYTAEETVTVKVRALEKAGELIAGVGSKGATNVSSLAFTVDDTDEAKAQVQAEAIADAKEKARVLAKSLGVRLGDLQSFYDNEPMPSYYESNMGMGGMMKADAYSAPQVSAGESKISASVSLTYKIH